MTKKKSEKPAIEREPHGFYCELCDSVYLANLSKKEYALRIHSLAEYHKTHGYSRIPDWCVLCPVCMEDAQEYPLDERQPEAMRRMVSLGADYFGKYNERENKFELKKEAGFRIFVCEKCGATAITELTDIEYGMRFDTHGKLGYPHRHNLECPICMGDMWNTNAREGTSRNLEKISTPLIVSVARKNRSVKKK